MKSLRLLLSFSAVAALPHSLAIAGEEILYAPAPKWVEVKPLANADGKGAPLVLLEQQVRLEGGTVTNYNDMAIRLSSPEALTQAGTLTAQWMPDKGDLVIHRVELLREGNTVDVIAQGRGAVRRFAPRASARAAYRRRPTDCDIGAAWRACGRRRAAVLLGEHARPGARRRDAMARHAAGEAGAARPRQHHSFLASKRGHPLARKGGHRRPRTGRAKWISLSIIRLADR